MGILDGLRGDPGSLWGAFEDLRGYSKGLQEVLEGYPWRGFQEAPEDTLQGLSGKLQGSRGSQGAFQGCPWSLRGVPVNLSGVPASPRRFQGDSGGS